MTPPLGSTRTADDDRSRAGVLEQIRPTDVRSTHGSRVRAGLVVLLSLVVVSAVFLPTVAAAGAPTSPGVAASETPAANETAAQDGPDDVEALVDDVMAEQLDEGVPGATVAVVEGDDTVLAKGYGEADTDAGTPVRADGTAFEIGSVSKLVTWTAVMQAAEDGAVDLDEDVNVYLEDSEVEVPDAYDEPVTLRHLATHTAGFDVRADPGVVADPGEVTSIEEALAEDPPDRVRPPGETVSYSNYGATLAGHVVAEAYDTTFEEYVETEIYDPLGMDHSTFAAPVPDDHPGEQAAPHELTEDGPTVVERNYITWRPAGSMTATATDMAAFMSAHLGEGTTDDVRILEPETAAEMHAVQHERHPAVNGWRFGFYEYGDGDLIAHDGATTHFTSLLVLAPEEDVGVFVNYNVRGAEGTPDDVVDAILEAYGIQPGSDDSERTSSPGVADRADEVSGEYAATMVPGSGPAKSMGLMMRASVDATDDAELVVETIDGQSFRFVEAEPYVYREVDGDDVVAFDVESGEATAMYMSSQPPTDWTPVPLHEQLLVVGATAGVALVGFVLSLLGWTGAAALRKWRGWRGTDAAAPQEAMGDGSGIPARRFDRLRRPSRLARIAAAALCAVSLGFVALFVVGLGTGGPLAFVLPPASLHVALALPPLVAVLVVATAVGAALAWREGYWSRRVRVHQTVLAVLGVAFGWQLVQFGFLGL